MVLQSNLLVSIVSNKGITVCHTLQESHERVCRVCLGEIPPAGRVEFIGRLTPVHWEAVDGVGHQVDRGASGNVVSGQGIIFDGLAHRHGDRRDVAQGFFADILQIWQQVDVGFFNVFFNVASQRVEQEGHVLANLLAEFALDVWILGEKKKCPSHRSRGRVMSADGQSQCARKRELAPTQLRGKS